MLANRGPQLPVQEFNLLNLRMARRAGIYSPLVQRFVAKARQMHI